MYAAAGRAFITRGLVQHDVAQTHGLKGFALPLHAVALVHSYAAALDHFAVERNLAARENAFCHRTGEIRTLSQVAVQPHHVLQGCVHACSRCMRSAYFSLTIWLPLPAH